MPDYSKGKVYIIRSNQTNLVYIGSTTQTLANRMAKHRYNYKLCQRGERKHVSSNEILKFEDAYIELLENINCSCKNELSKAEGEYVRKIDCVNIHIPGRSRAEYREDNKEKLKQQWKSYREKNKDTIKEKDRIYREDNKEKIKTSKSAYYQKNKEIISAKAKQYREDNKEKLKQRWKSYREKNKDAIKEKAKKYRKSFQCECGGSYNKYTQNNHNLTKRHQEYVKQIEDK